MKRPTRAHVQNSATAERDSDIRDSVAASYLIGDAELRADLDGLARLAARICDTSIALVSLVTPNSKLVLGSCGLEVEAVPREHSFSSQTILHADGMTVPDATRDARFAENPLVTSAPHIRFCAGHPLVSAAGTPVGSLCVFDKVPRAGLSDAQRDSLKTIAKAAMACMERWRRSGASPLQPVGTGIDRGFKTLADALPQLVWSTPPNGLSDFFSRQWCEYTGAPAEASIDTGWLDFLHPEDVPRARAAWQQAVETAQPYSVEYRVRNAGGAYRCMLALGLPVTGDEGEVIRWVGTCTDIDERVRTAEALELMSQELSHRIKNLFAITQGLISMTLRPYPEMLPVSRALQERMVILGRAHDLVRPRISDGTNWHSTTSLRELIDHLLAPYHDDYRARVAISGDALIVSEHAVTPLSLFFHELATNSAKHGALSRPEGRLQISVAVSEAVVIEWRESGGPPISHVPVASFGLGLVSMTLERQMRGTLTYDWAATGLVLKARIPLTSLTRS